MRKEVPQVKQAPEAAAQLEETAKDRELTSEKEMQRAYRASQQLLSESDREKIALQYLVENETVSVSQLHDAIWSDPVLKDNPLLKAETADLVWRLVDQDKAELEYLPVATFAEFLRHWERNMWVYASFAFSLATILAIYVVSAGTPYMVLRWVFGSGFVLFIPGYVAAEALFPKVSDLSSIEHFALSIGLSLALVTLVGFLLNYTPWGISLLPIVVSLTTLTVALGTVALVRQYKSV